MVVPEGNRTRNAACGAIADSHHPAAVAASVAESPSALDLLLLAVWREDVRFVAVVRVLTWPLARDHGVRYPTFLALDVLGALAWTTKWAGLGWLLGAHWSEASAEVRWISVALVVAGVLAFVTVRLWRRARHRAAESPAR